MLNFEDVKELAQVIKQRGGRALLVGGYVRDQLMGRESKDFDLEVFGLELATLSSELIAFAQLKHEKLSTVGQSFQVVKVGLNLDVSVPRRDRKVGEGHKGFEIDGDPYMSTIDAARRRDFTMNALLLDPLTGQIFDHFTGRADIDAKLVRVVDPDTFVEDSLRALRAVQFASRFGFGIATKTFELIQSMDLRDLPRERVWGEIEKWLMQSEKPSHGLFLMQQLGILEKLFPEIENLVGVPQDMRWHPEGDVFVHTALALDVAKTAVAGLPYPEQVTVMLATLCHDLGKAETTEIHEFVGGVEVSSRKYGESFFPHDLATEQRVTAHGHAEAGVSLARNVLDRLAVHSIEGYDVRGQVLALVENHLAPFEFHRHPPRDSAFRRLALKVDLNLLHKVAHADAHSRNGNSLGRVFGTEGQDWFLDKIQNLSIPPKGPDRILMGRHLIELGVKPSKRMGEILDKVFEAQIEGTVTDVESGLALARQIIAEDA